MVVYTSQYRYSGADRLDITAGSEDDVGRLFSPEYRMVLEFSAHRITEDEYMRLYMRLMVERLHMQWRKWQNIMSRERVTLVCFCKAGKFCHRLIAKDILVGRGAEYGGEIK